MVSHQKRNGRRMYCTFSGMDGNRERWQDGSPHYGLPWCAGFPSGGSSPGVSLMAGIEGFCLRDFSGLTKTAKTVCEIEGAYRGINFV